MAIVLDGTNGINTPDLESAGPVSGTTGTFSGAVRASGVATNIYPLVSATDVTASGTSVDFTGIPSWVKRITVMFDRISTSGTSLILVRVGTVSGFLTSGYLSGVGYDATTGANSNSTAGFLIAAATSTTAATTISGSMIITNLNSVTWVEQVGAYASANSVYQAGGGVVSISDTLTQIRITTTNGTDTFDAGSINIMYE